MLALRASEGAMSQPETADKPKTTWPVLDAQERRVLGVLVEKAKTTPDSYPMSLNALVAGCNQKSNREPIMDLEDVEVEDTLSRLQKKGLVVRDENSSLLDHHVSPSPERPTAPTWHPGRDSAPCPDITPTQH